MTMELSILSCACYLPRRRLSGKEIAAATGTPIRGLEAKAIADLDEDALTMGLVAARELLSGDSEGSSPPRIGAVATASTSFPYLERVQTGLLIESLGLPTDATVFELAASSRAATEALIALSGGLGWRENGRRTGLLIAADRPWSDPSPASDRGAGAGALLLAREGMDEEAYLARVDAVSSWTGEAPGLDFIRRGRAGRDDIQVPGYASDILARAAGGATERLFSRTGTSVEDYRFAAIGTLDPRTVRTLTRAVGLTERQWRPPYVYAETGNLGAAGPIVSLIAALDEASPGDRILWLTYGSGSTLDAIALTVGLRSHDPVVRPRVEAGTPVAYVDALKLHRED